MTTTPTPASQPSPDNHCDTCFKHVVHCDCSQQPSPAPICSCPSGDGSLRWPCPQHPPEVAAPVGVDKQGAQGGGS
jgi:hypothetical protein